MSMGVSDGGEQYIEICEFLPTHKRKYSPQLEAFPATLEPTPR